MTVRLVAVVFGLTALAGGATLFWPRSEPALRVVNDRLAGEMTGYVTRAHPEDQTVDVSRNFLGLRPITMHVDRQTTIIVGEKEGALADLVPGVPVFVDYHMEGDRRVAKVIQLDAGRMPRSTPPPATPPVASAPVERPAGEMTEPPATPALRPEEVTVPARRDEDDAAAVAVREPVETAPAPSSVEAPGTPPELPPRAQAPVEPRSRQSRARHASAIPPVSTPPAPSYARPSPPPAPPQTLPPRESVLDLSTAIHDWIEAGKRRDVSAQVALYADRLDHFYGRPDLPREAVRAEKLRAFGSGEVLLGTGSPEIRLELSGHVASVRFSKRFVVDNEGQARYGTATQELRWLRTSRGWRIIAESDTSSLRGG